MENQLVPKLRFPGFDGEWNAILLKDIASFSKGRNISKADILQDGVYECIRYGELYTRYNELISEVYSRTSLEKKLLVFSEANDIIIPASGESAQDIATASCVLRSGIALGGDLNIIKTKENGIFLSYYFNNKKKHDIAKRAQGISVIHIYGEHLKSLELNFPSLVEQQKIADYLSSIDKKLNLLEEKKAELSRYKKAMMQKLFSQEIRFKDENGKDFPDLEEKLGGEIFRNHTNKNHNGELDILAITQEHGAIPRHLIDYSVQVSTESVSNYKIVEKNDFIISLRSFQGGIEHSNYMGICSPAYTVLKYIKPINPIFYKAFFKSRNYINYLNRTLEGIRDGKMISFANFAKSKLPYPSLPEQNKIADFLSAIDDNINKVEEQIQQTQAFKKAMLQEMFV